VACLEVLVAGDACNEGEDVVVRQGQLIAFVVAFLIGSAVVLMAGASGVQAQASNKEEARCEGTRKINVNLPARFTSNDLPGCPKGGLLLGTDKDDSLAGEKGDDEVRGLGGSDFVMGGLGNDVIYGGADNDSLHGDGSEEEGNDIIYGGPGDDDVNVFLVGDDGNDVIYGGPGDDDLRGFEGEDAIYGGPGDDKRLDGGPSDAVYGGGELLPGGGDGQRDKIYCGEGRDSYFADKEDYVDSSCEVKLPNSLRFPKGEATVMVAGGGEPPSGSPVPVPPSGGAAILLPAAALLVGSGILTYAILRRR
jgi:Ca2+-binding RTX toxin-like protein